MTTQPRDPLAALREDVLHWRNRGFSVDLSDDEWSAAVKGALDAVLQRRLGPLVTWAQRIVDDVFNPDENDWEELQNALAAMTAEPGKEQP